MNNRNAFIVLSIIVSSIKSFSQDQSLRVQSPDSTLEVSVHISDSIYYSVRFEDNVVVQPSSVALQSDKGFMGIKPKLKRSSRQSVDQMLDVPVPARRSKVHDQYNQLTLEFKGGYSLLWRVYNDGVAYRWRLGGKDSLRVFREIASFNFAQNDTVYYPQIKCPYSADAPQADCYHSNFEDPYKKLPLGSIGRSQRAYLPILIDGEDRYKILLSEADLVGYPGMFVVGNPMKPNSLIGDFARLPEKEIAQGPYRQDIVLKRREYIAKIAGTVSLPWRFLIITKDEKSLPYSDMVFKLAEPSRVRDWSWIKPGKSTSEWLIDNNIYGVDFRSGYNTATYKYYIDFAARFNLEYVLFDAGWSAIPDLFEVTKTMDMEFLTKYAREKNVGLVLWTSGQALKRQLLPALDKFQQWGIKGIMVDFLDRDDQVIVDFYETVAKETAKRKIFVDFHGSFKPTGMERTYPNVITREGAMVQEYNKWSDDKVTPEHDVLLSFIRNVVGPLDYEPGNMLNESRSNFHISSDKPVSQGTRIHQLSMFVIYDGPYSKLGGNPSDYLRDSLFTSFLISVPTVWRETKVLDARIGDYIVVLRETRNGEYFLAAMNDWTPRELIINIDFLGDGSFILDSFMDGANADRYASDYAHSRQKIDSPKKQIKISLAAGGGWVGHFKRE